MITFTTVHFAQIVSRCEWLSSSAESDHLLRPDEGAVATLGAQNQLLFQYTVNESAARVLGWGGGAKGGVLRAKHRKFAASKAATATRARWSGHVLIALDLHAATAVTEVRTVCLETLSQGANEMSSDSDHQMCGSGGARSISTALPAVY